MSQFATPDLSRVPLPELLQDVDFEQEFKEIKQRFLTAHPHYADALALESDPLTALLQTLAYQQVLHTQQANDAVRGVMLATATGADLDAIASRYNLLRGDAEEDSRFRQRIQLAFDGLNTAGSASAYTFHALSLDTRIRDVTVSSPAPCDIALTILSTEGDGTPPQALLEKVGKHFAAQGWEHQGGSQVRPLGDRVTVRAAEIVPFTVKAELVVLPGPSANAIRQAAEAALQDYLVSRQALGKKVTRAGLFAALHREGVDEVHLLSPASNVSVTDVQSAWCEHAQVTVAVKDE
ncbi:baseplate J/gp47 family protein [Pseudoalteromonas sp. McH1-42]|uniref:baseplate assembly protein n=1 Tax=Pseudoalteromonas sp. McH1-42 TaxID=2917752 RepID=UPI001EF4C9FF|nr:baseplate J/gp47 family protein [Pseudoalteromonas sp. McH1-42]MCG7560762.1 baseplate J/gp47 family protein [Pseudoalteromonas sp. McH1-42]